MALRSRRICVAVGAALLAGAAVGGAVWNESRLDSIAAPAPPPSPVKMQVWLAREPAPFAPHLPVVRSAATPLRRGPLRDATGTARGAGRLPPPLTH